jgi:hypothetical protein
MAVLVFVVDGGDFRGASGGCLWLMVVVSDPDLDSNQDSYLWWLLRYIWLGFSLRLSFYIFHYVDCDTKIMHNVV